MEKKAIDAVRMTRQIRDAHAEQLKDASPSERIRFFREKAQRVNRSLEQASSVTGSPRPA